MAIYMQNINLKLTSLNSLQEFQQVKKSKKVYFFKSHWVIRNNMAFSLWTKAASGFWNQILPILWRMSFVVLNDLIVATFTTFLGLTWITNPLLSFFNHNNSPLTTCLFECSPPDCWCCRDTCSLVRGLSVPYLPIVDPGKLRKSVPNCQVADRSVHP